MKCSCYHEEQEIRYVYGSKTGKRLFSYEVPVGSCWGTRERDACGCGGDTKKCDFYPEKRIEKCDATPLTNANKIRSMSDSELVDFICKLYYDCCECKWECNSSEYSCGLSEWLQKPYVEGEKYRG